MKIDGKVKFEDLDGGVWILVADDGSRYMLASDDDGLLTDGQAVSVEGEVKQDMMGIGMAGPMLAVRGWSAR